MADGANDRIADLFTEHALDLLRFDAAQRRQVRAFLRDLEADLVAQLTRADPAGAVRTETKRRRLERLLDQVRDTIRASYRRTGNALAGELRELADIEAEFAARAINDGVGFNLATVELTRNQAAALASDVLVQGAPVKEWWERQAGDTLRRFTDEMRRGIAEGETNAQLVRRIRGGTQNGEAVKGFMDISRRNAEGLVRSATQAVSQAAREETYRQNSDLVKAVVWLATLDTRTTVGCFPAETSALPCGDLRGVFKRRYKGDLVIITTASGKKLRCTPKHPVLTARGWRPAEELKPGADVLQRVVSDVVGVVAGEDIAMPATLGAISDALLKIPGVDVSVERSSEADFHGDGQAGFYEIHRPSAESDLRLEVEAAGQHEVAKSLLVGVHLASSFAALGHGDAAFLGRYFGDEAAQFDVVPAQNGVEAGLGDTVGSADVGRLHPVSEGLDDPAFVGPFHGLAAAQVLHDASALEQPGHCRGGDAVSLGDLGGGGSVSIVADDVVSVERELFSGHVFNLHTSLNFYIAEGFLVHNCAARDGLQYEPGTHDPIGHDLPWDGGPGNRHWGCRSTSSPVLKSWRELGFDRDELPAATRASMDGQVPQDTSFEAWLSRQSQERQDAVLGPGRAQLWRDGGLTFRDLIDGNGRELTVEELRARARG